MLLSYNPTLHSNQRYFHLLVFLKANARSFITLSTYTAPPLLNDLIFLIQRERLLYCSLLTLNSAPESNVKILYQVVGFCRDDFSSLGVPQNQVCVSAHSDAPLPGVAVEDLGSIGAGHRYKIVLVHLPRDLGKRRGKGPSPEMCPAPSSGQQPRPTAGPMLSHQQERGSTRRHRRTQPRDHAM